MIATLFLSSAFVAPNAECGNKACHSCGDLNSCNKLDMCEYCVTTNPGIQASGCCFRGECESWIDMECTKGPVPSTLYQCGSDGLCHEAATGVSHDACKLACYPPPADLYKCQDGECKAGPTGVSKETCESSCTAVFYKCVNNTCTSSPTGVAKTACTAACG